MNKEYEKSIHDIIHNVKNETNVPNNIDYFIALIKSRHLYYNSRDNDIALLSVLIPEEIIRGLGLNPIWCLSGSQELGSIYSESFPRDVDPVVKSSYGMYMQYDMPAIIAFQNDSFRKVSWLLKENENEIYELDIPFIKDMDKSSSLFEQSINTMISKLQTRYKTTLKSHNLYNAHTQIQAARKSINRLIKLQGNTDLLSSYILHFIISAYYCTENLKEYTHNVNQIIDELSTPNASSEKLRIGLLGSPLFFPNDKILNMTKSLGIDVDFTYNEVNMFLKSYDFTDDSNIKEMITSICTHYFEENIMPHNISKSILIKEDLSHLDGVIYHVLKGQIAYDYNFLKLESFVKVPKIRLETDYNKEDVEQIKIRVEAFIEMISVLKSN